jgi:hypothetical protein
MPQELPVGNIIIRACIYENDYLGSERAIPTQRASYCLVSACLRFAL